MTDELYLVLTLIANPSFIYAIKKGIHSGEFQDKRAVRLMRLIEENEIPESLDDFLLLLDPQEPLFFYKEWFGKEEMNLNVDETLRQGVYIIKKRNLELRSREIAIMLNKNSHSDDRVEAELLNEKMRIDRDIQNFKVL